MVSAVRTEHYPVFDCAVSERAIHYLGHVRMMGASRSSARPKTVNLPEEATTEDVDASTHGLGVKAIACNCKAALRTPART